MHNALRRVQGVACAQVDFNSGIAVVRGIARFEDLAAAVEKAGFSAKALSSSDKGVQECDRDRDAVKSPLGALHAKETGVTISVNTLPDASKVKPRIQSSTAAELGSLGDIRWVSSPSLPLLSLPLPCLPPYCSSLILCHHNYL